MEDESANEMDSNQPLPSHHHLEPMVNESRKRTNHQTGNYHSSLAMVDGMGQPTGAQQNFLAGWGFDLEGNFSIKTFSFSSRNHRNRRLVFTLTSIDLFTTKFTE